MSTSFFKHKTQCHHCKNYCHDNTCSSKLFVNGKQVFSCINCSIILSSQSQIEQISTKVNENSIYLNKDCKAVNLSSPKLLQDHISSSFAETSKCIIEKFNSLLTSQIDLSLSNFPLDSDQFFCISYFDSWCAIEYLSLVCEFRIDQIEKALLSVETFANRHFEQKRNLIKEKFEIASSTTTELATKGQALSEMIEVIDYLTKLVQYYDSNKNYLKDPENRYHYIIFKSNSSIIISEWVDNIIPNLHDRIVSSKRKDFSSLSSDLVIAQAFSMFDSFITSADKKFSNLVIQLDDAVKQLSTSIQADIDNGLYDKVADFFISQKDSLMSSSTISIFKDLTSNVEAKLKSLSLKVNNIVNREDITLSSLIGFSNLQYELSQIDLARESVLPYLEEHLRNSLPDEIDRIRGQINQSLLSVVCSINLNSDYETCEKYHQRVIEYYEMLLRDHNYKNTNELKSEQNLIETIRKNREYIQNSIQFKINNMSILFEGIYRFVESDRVDTIDLVLDKKEIKEIRNPTKNRKFKKRNSITAEVCSPTEKEIIGNQIDGILFSLQNKIKLESPRALIQELKAASNIGESGFYNQQIAFLEQMLEDKLNSIITLLNQPIASNIKLLISDCMISISSYFPERLQFFIEANVKSFQDRARMDLENAERELKSNNFSEILKNLKIHVNRKNYDLVISASKKLKLILKESLDLHYKDLKNGNILNVINNLPIALELYWEYIEICDHIGNSKNFNLRYHVGSSIIDYTNVNKVEDIMKFLSDKLKLIIDSVPKVVIILNDRNIFKSAHRTLEILYSLMTSFNKARHFWEFLIENFCDVQNEVINTIGNIVSIALEYNNSIEKELSRDDVSFSHLVDLLDVYKTSDDLINLLKNILIYRVNINEIELDLPLELSKKVDEMNLYSKIMEKIEDFIRESAKECQRAFNMEDLIRSGSTSDSRDFFIKLSKVFGKLKSTEDIQSLSRIDIHSAISESEYFIEMQLLQLFDDGKKHIQSIFNDQLNPFEDEDSYRFLNAYLYNLQEFAEIFLKIRNARNIGSKSKYYFETLLKISKKYLKNYQKYILPSNCNSEKLDVNKVLSNLEIIKICSCHVDFLQQYADGLIDNLLDALDESVNIDLMRIISENPQKTYYQMLLQHKKFEESLLKLWEEVVSRFTIDQILDSEYGVKISKDNQEITTNDYESIKVKLHHFHDRFQSRYTELTEYGLIASGNRADYLNELVTTAYDASTDSYEDKIVEFMACIFSYWTLHKIKEPASIFDDNDIYQNSDDDYVNFDNLISRASINSKDCTDAITESIKVKPHVGQLVAIFRIFGLDQEGSIEKHVIEVLTGEGKSIILGVAAIMFALLGLSVDCVCYSSYLSSRDKNSFNYLFLAFKVDEYIKYGTLNELCEKAIEDLSGGNIRASTLLSLGIESPNFIQRRISNRSKVLLIDEVDVFFGEDFYGNVYVPIAKLVDPTITNIVNYIWNLKDDTRNFHVSKVLSSNQFIACKEKFKSYEIVIEEAVKLMFFQLHELLNEIKLNIKPSPSQVPYVFGDSIAYKDQDTLSTQISFGYKTMWTYFIEHSKKNISDKFQKSEIYIRVNCGQYSIAEVPKLYNHIIGVSGTISAVVNDKVIPNTYNIHKETRIPSVYGRNKLKFHPIGPNADIKISVGVSHFNDIADEVMKRSHIEGKMYRPVLIFFESITELNNYYQSEHARKYKNRTKLLTEKESDISKTNLIRNATSMNAITLLTREFGRGTDFIVYDEKVRKAGGPHVIQTFLSEDVSEEIQIKGRTARQGGDGSFSMVLSSSQLEKFFINQNGPNSIDYMIQSGQYGETLDIMRLAYVETIRGGMKIRVDEFLSCHYESLNFIQSLTKQDNNRIRDYLYEFNYCPKEYLVICDTRILVLMDATGSMSSCILNAKNTVGEWFKKVHAVLKEKNLESYFEVQFAVYRNYNAPMQKIVEWSEWTSHPAVLYQFINKIKACYGQGHEAIEMGFWHLNKELDCKKIDRVILIGDQRANTYSEVCSRRAEHHGENYWLKQNIGEPFTYIDQLKQIKEKNEDIIINTYYVNGDYAKPIFEEIARATKGNCKSLDVQDVAIAAETLCEESILNILEAINLNNSTILNEGELVKIYKRLFKGYVE